MKVLIKALDINNKGRSGENRGKWTHFKSEYLKIRGDKNYISISATQQENIGNCSRGGNIKEYERELFLDLSISDLEQIFKFAIVNSLLENTELKEIEFHLKKALSLCQEYVNNSTNSK
jgi:hypothetical protein